MRLAWWCASLRCVLHCNNSMSLLVHEIMHAMALLFINIKEICLVAISRWNWYVSEDRKTDDDNSRHKTS